MARNVVEDTSGVKAEAPRPRRSRPKTRPDDSNGVPTPDRAAESAVNETFTPPSHS
jgi:hypothetical protein